MAVKNKETIKEIIQTLTDLRKAKGMRQQDVADRVPGWSKQYVSKLENGHKDFTADTLLSWTNAVGVELIIHDKGNDRGYWANVWK